MTVQFSDVHNPSDSI